MAFAYQADERDVYDFFLRAGKLQSKLSIGDPLSLCMLALQLPPEVSCFLGHSLWGFNFQVQDVRLIMDRNSRCSKRVGFIEFLDAMSVPMAIALSGQPLLGQPIMVKPSEVEKNLVQSTIATAGAVGRLIGSYSGGARRVCSFLLR
ncbi:unnamed protein product [Camellia sinensis]